MKKEKLEDEYDRLIYKYKKQKLNKKRIIRRTIIL